MTIFRKKIQYLYKKIYNYLCCITKEPILPNNDYCSNCREYLLNQVDDDSSINEFDYNKIYVDSEKLDSFG